MSIDKIGNNLNVGTRDQQAGESVVAINVEEELTSELLSSIIRSVNESGQEDLKMKILGKIAREGRKFASKESVVEYLQDIWERMYSEEYLKEVFESTDKIAMQEIADYHALTVEQMELAEHYAKLRRGAIDEMRKQLAQRKYDNPEFDENEKLIEVHKEQIEPQVRDAVFNLVKKGYQTFGSGFWGADSQSIYCKNKYFRDFSFSNEFIEKMAEKGVDLGVEDSSIFFNLHKKLSLEELKLVWDEIEKEIPATEQG